MKKELQEAIDYCDEKINVRTNLLENNLKTVAKEGEKEAQIKLESCVNSIKNFQVIIKLVKKQIEELKKTIKDKKDYENLALKQTKENEKRIEHLECRMKKFFKKDKINLISVFQCMIKYEETLKIDLDFFSHPFL